jgi:hypothetical protein
MRNEILQSKSMAIHQTLVKGEKRTALKDSCADYWTETFGCSRDELQKALKKIGIIERSKQNGSRAIL